MSGIASLDEFEVALGEVWKGIANCCAVCTDPDCLGYVWVVEEEEEALLDAGVQLVQINGVNGPTFLDSYARDGQGRLIPNQLGPKCPWRAPNGRCTVHAARPLACHLYPLGLERDGQGWFEWGLHCDCHYVRSQDERELHDLLSRLRALLAKVAPDLMRAVVATFRDADAIAAEGRPPNRYIAVAPAMRLDDADRARVQREPRSSERAEV